MKDLILYLAKASVALIACYGFYWILMRKDTFFLLNRWYLLVSALVSLLIPLVNPGFLLPEQVRYISLLPEITVGTITSSVSRESAPDAFTVLGIVWLGGSLFFILRLFIRLGQIFRIIRTGRRERLNRLNLVIVENEIRPFSFFRYVFLPERMRGGLESNPVYLHERLHAGQLHTFDLLVSELLIAFFWFNPVVYLVNRSLKSMHEFLADEAVLRAGIGTAAYRELIARTIPGIHLNSFATSFNVSLIQKRIAMMTKMRTSPIARIKMVLAGPMLIVLVFLMAGNTPAQTRTESEAKQKEKQLQVTRVEQEQAARESEARLKEEQQQAEAEQQKMKKQEEAYTAVEKQPRFPGGDEKLVQFLASNITYPQEAKKKGVQGAVYVQFVVTAEGKVRDAKIVRGIGSGCDEEALRVVKMMPDWIPGEIKGKKVNVIFTLPIKFALN